MFLPESPNLSDFSTLGFFGNNFEGPSQGLKIVNLTLSYYYQVSDVEMSELKSPNYKPAAGAKNILPKNTTA